MTQDTESRFVDGVMQRVGDMTGRPPGAMSWTWIARPDGKSEVPDATLAVNLTGGGADMVLLISNARFPDATDEALGKIEAVAARLRPGTAKVILRPSVSGREEGRSFAAFPRLRTFSDNWVLARLEKDLIAGAVIDWLCDIARQTRAPVPRDERDRLFAAPLTCVSEDADLGPELRAAADAALAGLPDDLFTVVEHNDFWTGNILMPPRSLPLLAPARGEFRVIDWRGARLDGYPFGDLIRFGLSARRADAPRTGRELADYAGALDIPRSHVAHYVLSAIGRVGLNRGGFPKDRYAALSMRIFRLLERHGYA